MAYKAKNPYEMTDEEKNAFQRVSERRSNASKQKNPYEMNEAEKAAFDNVSARYRLQNHGKGVSLVWDTGELRSKLAKQMDSVDYMDQSSREQLQKDWRTYKSNLNLLGLYGYDVSESKRAAQGMNSVMEERMQYFGMFANADEYNAHVSYLQDRQEKLDYDLSAGQQKIDDLTRAMDLATEINAIAHDVPGYITREYDGILEQYGLTEADDLERLITDETVMLNQSKLVQKEEELSSVVELPDFVQYSEAGAAIKNPSYGDAIKGFDLFGWRPFAEDVQNKVTFARDNAQALYDERQHGASAIFVVDPVLRHMTEEEVSIYNYYLAKDGEQKAEEYLESIQDKLNQREAAEEYDRLQGRTGLEIMYGATVGADQFKSGISALFDGSDYIAPSAIQYAGQAVREDLADNGLNILGSSLGQLGYDALSTTANMTPSILATMAVGAFSKTAGAVAGNVLLGGSAAGNAYAEKLNMGYSKEQASTYGVMVGASEIAMEKLLGGISALGGGALSKVAIKNLDKIDNILARVAKSAGGKILMNAGSEALEEGLQSILEPYIWQAVSGEEASVDWEETLYSSLLGFVTGGVFEGGNVAANAVAENAQALQTYGNEQGALVETALELDPANSFAQKMQGRIDSGRDLSGAQLNKLVKDNEAAFVEADISTIAKAAESALSRYGETGDVKLISEALAKQAAGQSLSRAERKAISESKYGQRVANELNPENIRSGNYNTAWAEKLGTERIHAEEYGGRLAESEPEAEAMPEWKKPSKYAPRPDTRMAFAQLEANAGKGNAAKVSVSMELLSKKYGAQAEAMMATYNEGQDVFRFDRAYERAYEMGRSGIGREYMLKNEAVSYLTEEQRRLAYAAGVSARTAQDTMLDTRNKANSKEGGLHKKGAVKLEGVNPAEFRKMLKSKNDPRGKAIKALMTIAEATGVDIVLYKSKVDAHGRFVGAQGKFAWKNDTVYVDLNAGLSYAKDAGELTKYTMLRTFSHEFTHFIEKNAPVQYSELQKAVFAELKARGENVNDLIEDKMELYKQQKLSYEAASREVVADAMSDILRDSTFLETLAQKHQTLFEKLRTQFKKFAARLRSYFNALADNPHIEAKALQEQLGESVRYAENIVKLFDKAAVVAVETYQARTENEISDEEQVEQAERDLEADVLDENSVDSSEEYRVQYQHRGYSDESEYVGLAVDDIKDIIKNGVGIRWNNGNVLRLPKNEYAAVMSRISTEYYRKHTRGGVQFVERSTDGPNAKFYLYLYLDHGFDNYEIICRLDYSNHEELINFLRREIDYGRKTEGIPKSTNRLRTFHEHALSGRDDHKNGTGHETDGGKNSGSGGTGVENNGRFGGPDFGGYHEDGLGGQHQLRTNTLTDHEILDMAAKELDTSKLTEAERDALAIFRKRLDKLNALKEQRAEQGRLYREQQFGKNVDRFAAAQTRNRMQVLDSKIQKASNDVLSVKNKAVLKSVLQKSRKIIEQQERAASRERVRAAREQTRARERRLADERLSALREKKNQRIAEVRAEERERTTARVQKVREDQKSSKLREKIKAFKTKLEQNLLHPTERQYVPAGLTQAMIDVVNLIDIDTELVRADGSVNKAQERRDETKHAIADLAAEYERLKASDPVYAGEFDETVYAYLAELRDSFAGRHLSEMTFDELSEMYDILRSVEETLQDARKLIGWGDAETVYEAGEAIIAEQEAISAKRKNGKRNWTQEKRDNTLALTLSPVRYVERMSAYNQDSYLLRLFQGFEKGIRKKNFFKMQAYKSFESLTSRQQFEDAIYKPVGKTYTDAKGRSFRLSKMQMMQAIMSIEREQANNMNHIARGGFIFADMDMLRKGKLKEAISAEHSHRVANAVDMVGEFIDLLKNDKWAQDYMAAARRFFNETAKDAINETSLALKHRIVAKDKSYIPFEVDGNFIVKEISAANDVQQTINSYGMLKDTKKFASNPLIITGLNNILDRHIEQVGNVYGLAIEIRNFNKVWNVKGLEEGDKAPTVQEVIEGNWGEKGKALVEQAVQDIQGPRINNQSDLYKKVKSGYIGATFLLNLSVVTKQVGSLFSANSMLRWRGPVRQVGNLIYTMSHSKKLSAEVDKYTASAWMRRQGLSDAEVYTLMTEGKRTFMGRLARKAPTAVNPTKWITAMDHAVALSLWKYAKEDTAKRTGLKGEALLEAAAEFYDQVVENTQSMTDVLHRPEIQKRSDVFSESLGMFKTDLYQMAGQLLSTYERNKALHTKDTKQALRRTVYAVVMSAVWAQLMTSVFALLRYKVNPYRDDEDKDLTVESWLKRQGFALVGDFAGYIFPLLGSETVGMIENMMYDESEDMVDSLAVTAINDLLETLVGIGSSLKDGEMPKTNDLRKLTTKALQLFGVPANNILRTIDAIQLHAEDIANGEFFSFEAGVYRSAKHHAHRIIETLQEGNADLAKAMFEEAVEESALKGSTDGSVSEDARKNAMSSLQSAFGDKLKNGEIDADMAHDILTELFGKSEDDAYWIIRSWETGGEPRYSAVFEAAFSGKGFDETVREMTEHGYEEKDVLSELKSEIKKRYTDPESEVKITKQQASDMLRKYVGMSANEVTSTINKWSCKVVTGIAYEDIKDEFIAGRMTESRAIEMRMRYGGKTKETATEEVEAWAFEKKYGFSYSERKDAYISGEVSAAVLREAMISFGGMSREEADETIKAYDWLKRNPQYDFSVSDVTAYTKTISELGYSVEESGIKPDVYLQYKTLRSSCKGIDANGDGKTDSGSVKADVLRAIDSLPISNAQKDALYYLNGWAKSKLWEAPWH